MNRVFADTSALVALKDSGDGHHQEALAYFESHLKRTGTQFLLTNYLVCEVHAYFCRTPSVALKYVDTLSREPIFKIVRAGQRDEWKAMEILRSSHDKTYSFADAVSFAVMERLRLKAAFAFDRHFRQRGTCRIVP